MAGLPLACSVLAILPLLALGQTPPPPPDKESADKIEPIRTTITVIENLEAEAPAVVSVLDSSTIRETAGTNLDDRLRSIPGFSLFRRASSVTAHPTTQGISLRGIGSSGASRTLVLWDGIPANDPFGGWVYWTRFEPDELERIEISRGASTSVFGDRAMGGAIAIFSRPPQRSMLHGRYEGGSQNTHDVSAGFSTLFSKFAVSVSGRGFTTDGYYIVPERLRGAIDRKAGLDFASGIVHIDYLGDAHHFFFKTDILAEDRRNGTALQNNSTGLGTMSMHYQGKFDNNLISLIGYRMQEGFHSTFSAIAAGRNTETLTFRQAVPAQGTGGAGIWNYSGKSWNLTSGADFFRVEGTSTDYLAAGTLRVGGGTQFQHGVFAQTDASWKSMKFFGGLRHQFTGQDATFLSPSAGVVVGTGRVRARGSVYRSFRAPTLNELFRTFRAGNAQTNANPLLTAETLFGSEVGLDVVGEASRLRVTLFRNSIEDLITNVTLSSTPQLILRERRNAASALGRGAEFSGTHRWRNWTGDLGYLFVDSRFGTGPRVPQIARHQGSAQLSFLKGGTMATLGLRSFAYAFDDDLNQFRLPGFATMHLMVRQRLTSNLSALASFDNLLDREYLTAFSPTPNIGAPMLWRIGLKWEGRVR